jgi:hypothetical protein
MLILDVKFNLGIHLNHLHVSFNLELNDSEWLAWEVVEVGL